MRNGAAFSDEYLAVDTVPPPKFAVEWADDIDITAAEEWLIADLLPNSGLAAIYGPPGCGKSFLALDAAMHIAAGMNWFGKPVMQGAVVYVAAEAGRGMRKRIKAWRMAHAADGTVPLGLVTVAPNLGTTRDGNAPLLIAEIQDQLRDVETPVRLIVLDTLARTMFGADENSAGDMGAFIANAGILADAFNCVVVAVHHSGKDTERGMRGSSALHGACDVEWQLQGSAATKTVSMVKNKEGADGIGWSFTLGVQTVFDPAEVQPATGSATPQNVAHGQPVTSCFVQPAQLPEQMDAPRSARPLGGKDKVIMDAITEAIADHGELQRPQPDMPLVTCVSRSKVREIAVAGGFGEGSKNNSIRSMLSVTITKLKGDGRIGANKERVWLP